MINSITIVGGGSAGWMTAATLIKSFPTKKISLIESKDIPIIGVGESTLGGIKKWTRYINLNENDFFANTDGSYKLSIKFTDFYKKNSGSFHYPFGFPMVTGDRNPFYDWQLKKYFFPDTPVDDFVRCLFPGSALFENNRFSLNEFGEFDNFNKETDVAYHFDAVKFGNWLKNYYCLPLGVNHIVGTVEHISVGENGIEKLVLDNGQEIFSDLYIDCTGFKSLLLSESLKEPFVSYTDILPNNRAWAARVPYKDRSIELEGFTNCTAIDNGWCWNIPLWSRLGTGYVYSDKYVSPDEALNQFKKYLMSSKMKIPRERDEVENLEFKSITMRVGIHKRTFVKNVVAIGLAAGFIEPLESNGLFTVHEFLFNLIDILQRHDISQFDRDMYNTSVYKIFDGFAQFVSMHYALSHRDDTEYWQKIKTKSFINLNNEVDPSISRLANYHELFQRYMEQWFHPLGNQGITYISTGMNLNMMNRSRINDIEFRNDISLLEDLRPILNKWEYEKSKWKSYSLKSPTLEDYLRQNFYKDRND